MSDHSKDNILRLGDVKARVKLSRTTIYRRIEAGRFPRPFFITPGITGWYESDIDAWVSNPMEWSAAA